MGSVSLRLESSSSLRPFMEPLAFQSAPLPPPGGASAEVSEPPKVRAETPTLAALFETEESGLLRFAIGLVGRRGVAEELVQETFLRLHQVWDQVENPRGWLYRSLRNLALNHLRDHSRETELDESTRPAEGDAPAEALGQMEAIGMVRMLLAEMTEEDRQLIRMKYNEDLKYRDISQRTGISVGNVGYRLHHLLKGLADTLRRAGIEGSRR
jgi:RNA polymerase sigma factor (sigma-70 family)